MYNTELEFQLVSILYHNQHLLSHRLVNRNDFFTDHGESLEKMMLLHEKNMIIDKTTIGIDYPVVKKSEVDKFEDYVRALKNLSLNRRLQNINDDLNKITLNDEISPYDKIVKMKNFLESLDICETDSKEYLISNFIDNVKKEIMEGKDEDVIKTAILELDELIAGGMRKGDFVLIAGDTGNFKSTLMYNICLNVAKQNKPVIIFSYENTKKEIIEIFISMLTPINSRVLKTKKIHGKNITEDKVLLEKINMAIEELKRLPLYIVDINASLTDVKLMALKNKVELVALDYIQIMPETEKSSKTESVGRISRTLKMMAKSDGLNCPIIGLSQFSKEDKANSNGRRTLNDLKDSSNLAQDPNIVIFTKKEEQRLFNGSKVTKIKISVEKQRNGETGQITLDINPMYHTIYGSEGNVVNEK